MFGLVGPMYRRTCGPVCHTKCRWFCRSRSHDSFSIPLSKMMLYSSLDVFSSEVWSDVSKIQDPELKELADSLPAR